jgi:two-component system, NtrC family, sensor kinase
MRKIINWFKGSIYRTMLLAFIVISVVPIILISFLFTRNSSQTLTQQMEANLQLLVESKAEEINLKLSEVMHSTVIASQLASSSLQVPVEPNEVSDRIGRYQLDHRNIFGLDVYYNETGGSEVLGNNLSNVYWTEALSSEMPVASKIVQTESLDSVFSGIKSVSPDTQWIYMTTPEGMMRLYPWADNDHYPDKWDPREIVFYTVAEPGNNPDLSPQWTDTYVDFAGAGWMVTASVPMVDTNGEFIGVMSHDVTIESLKQIALSINVLDGNGYGFLIDREGKVIAHPEFQDADAGKGTQEETSLLSWGTADFQTHIRNMVNGVTGMGYYADDSGNSLLVYAPIAETGWSLGISIPREQVIAPAISMQSRAIAITLLMVGMAVILAIILTRVIHTPLVQLLQGVKQVSAERQADQIQVSSFDELTDLAAAFNEMATRVWERETMLKEKVAKMRIEIDSQRKKKRLKSIVETDFFKQLESDATRLRAKVKNAAAATD